MHAGLLMDQTFLSRNKCLRHSTRQGVTTTSIMADSEGNRGEVVKEGYSNISHSCDHCHHCRNKDWVSISALPWCNYIFYVLTNSISSTQY